MMYASMGLKTFFLFLCICVMSFTHSFTCSLGKKNVTRGFSLYTYNQLIIREDVWKCLTLT